MLMMVGMALGLSTIVVGISKNSNYILPGNYIFNSLESIIYTIINNVVHIPLSTLLIIRNLGIVIYLVANIFFVLSFNNSILSDSKGRTFRRYIVQFILLSAFPLLYFALYHPNTAYWIYIINDTLDTAAKQTQWFHFFKVVDILVIICSILYLTYPTVYLISNYLKNRITFFSEQLLGLAISLALLNSTFFCMFFIGSFRYSIDTVFSSGLWLYKLKDRIPIFYISYLPFIMSMILFVVLYIVIRFKAADIINGFKDKLLLKNLNSLYLNQRDILHSNKNLMLRIKLLSEEALNNYGTDLGRQKIEAISLLCESNMSIASKTLDYIKIHSMHTITNDFISAVEDAIKEVSIPDGITIIKNYQQPHIYGNFDMYHITESIANLLNNSVDAIKSVYRDEHKICITVYASKSWIYCSISDTGCGIPKKLIKKIFTPYTSTKSKQSNWGVGLTYVFRIIKSHFGYIRFKSRLGRDTVVEILLPRSLSAKNKTSLSINKLYVGK
jgi:hypothetical protein